MARYEFTAPIAKALYEHYLSLWAKPTEEHFARLRELNAPAVLAQMAMEPRVTSEQAIICSLVQDIEEETDSKVRLRKQAALRRQGVYWSVLVAEYPQPTKEV